MHRVMEGGNTYTVIVTEETDFFEGWVDSRVPHMVFMYHQESLEECEEVDGAYYATYDSWVVDAERNVTYIKSDGTKVSLTIPVGEYGVKP